MSKKLQQRQSSRKARRTLIFYSFFCELSSCKFLPSPKWMTKWRLKIMQNFIIFLQIVPIRCTAFVIIQRGSCQSSREKLSQTLIPTFFFLSVVNFYFCKHWLFATQFHKWDGDDSFYIFCLCFWTITLAFLACDINGVTRWNLRVPMKTNFPVISVIFTLFSDGWKLKIGKLDFSVKAYEAWNLKSLNFDDGKFLGHITSGRHILGRNSPASAKATIY